MEQRAETDRLERAARQARSNQEQGWYQATLGNIGDGVVHGHAIGPERADAGSGKKRGDEPRQLDLLGSAAALQLGQPQRDGGNP